VPGALADGYFFLQKETGWFDSSRADGSAYTVSDLISGTLREVRQLQMVVPGAQVRVTSPLKRETQVQILPSPP
jgi:acyl dehydratase